MKPLRERLTAANSLLAPYAIPHEGLLGRMTKEPDDETRFPFQRDRDRIIHAQAFRRLQGKTQVFVAGSSDHVRTRLTHTMEVAQISRDMARVLGLNEDVAESIALAHDLGHPPFGHMGEAALNDWMTAHGSSFEHNEQSLRIVMLLEEHSPLIPGLNLNREILEGLRKHSEKPSGDRGHSVEAQIVNLADEIAYTAHDCEDGLQAGLFSMKELTAMTLVRDAEKRSSARKTSIRGALIHLLVADVYNTTEDRIRALNIQNLDDVYKADESIATFSESMQKNLREVRAFLNERMYFHPRVVDASKEGQRVITELCDRLLMSPTQKVLELQQKIGSSVPEAIKDYVAGMTDAFAKQQRLGL